MMSHCVGQLPTLQFQFIHTVFGEDNQNELPPQLRQIHHKENTYFFFSNASIMLHYETKKWLIHQNMQVTSSL